MRKQGEEVLNADLHVGAATLKFADVQAAKPAMKGDYVRVFLRIESEESFRAIYGAFASGGIINTEVYEARLTVCWQPLQTGTVSAGYCRFIACRKMGTAGEEFRGVEK